MKWSSILHWIAAITATIGTLALIGAWIVGSGTLFGQTQEHLFNDAKVLLLISIATGIGTLIHLQLEKK